MKIKGIYESIEHIIEYTGDENKLDEVISIVKMDIISEYIEKSLNLFDSVNLDNKTQATTIAASIWGMIYRDGIEIIIEDNK